MLLDVDTGVDDAIALALATRLTAQRLVAVTTVAGNVPIEYSTDNTLKVLNWLGADIPVYRGASEPLGRALHTAREHHGHDGLGGWALPSPDTTIREQTAPEAIIRLAREHRGEITFVCVGPLTNLAIALNLEPRIVDWVHKLVIMGGAFFNPGNVTSHAEFNIFVDPEAASVVARSGMDATWVGLDATHQTSITPDQWSSLNGIDDIALTLVRETTRRSLTELGREAFHLHDPLAVAVAERPEICSSVTGDVIVDTGEFRRGLTRVVDSVGSAATASVARHVDQQQFDSVFGSLMTRL